MIVKEHPFLPPADFSIGAINDPPSAGECVVSGLKRDGGLIQAFATSGRQMSVWGFCHRLNRRFHLVKGGEASQFDEICNKLAFGLLIR